VTNQDIRALLLQCEEEFMWCETHWGSDYTKLRAALTVAAASLPDEPTVTIPSPSTLCGLLGCTMRDPHDHEVLV
jgi:hypothetical protein